MHVIEEALINQRKSMEGALYGKRSQEAQGGHKRQMDMRQATVSLYSNRPL